MGSLRSAPGPATASHSTSLTQPHFETHHCAFLVSDHEFDEALARLRDKASRSTRTLCGSGPAKSITSTVAGVSTSTAQTATCSNSLRCLTGHRLRCDFGFLGRM